MTRAGVKPDIQDILYLLVILWTAARSQKITGITLEPGICSFLFKGPRDTLDHLGVAQDLAALLLDKHRDRHTPGALPGHTPVWPALDHAANPLFAGCREPTGCTDRLE